MGRGIPLKIATRLTHKCKGLLGAQPDEAAMIMIPCKDVHTVGMRHHLDVAFVDESGCVVEAHREVGPFRRLKNSRASAVVERFSTCQTPWLSKGDRIGIVWLQEE